MKKRKHTKIKAKHEFAPRETAPRPTTEDLIMKLPAELRNEIYELSFPRVQINYIGLYNRWREPAILRTSKQIRGEALPLYYNVNSFYLYTGTARFEQCFNWLESIMRNCGGKLSFKSFTMHISEHRHNAWENIDRLLPLAELLRKTNATFMKADKGKNKILPSWMTIGDYTRQFLPTGVQMFLRQIVQLGHKAREKGWSSQRLSEEYVQAVAKKKGTKPYQRYLEVKQRQIVDRARRNMVKDRKKLRDGRELLERQLDRVLVKIDRRQHKLKSAPLDKQQQIKHELRQCKKEQRDLQSRLKGIERELHAMKIDTTDGGNSDISLRSGGRWKDT